MAAAAKVPAQLGKRVGGAIYLHVSAVSGAEPGVRGLIERAVAAAPEASWNVVKVQGKAVSLLLYEDLDEVAFPALLASIRVETQTGTLTRTEYSGRDNPPILHRKETLLLSDDPRRPAFGALTRFAEEKGLFVQPHLIGTRKAWLARVSDAGLEIRGARLVPRETAAREIVRHRTAITRRDLSQPMQLLLANGVVAEGRSVFDYGCGQGDDVAALASNGFEAFGWDPHHAPDGPRKPADVVNLGFVLNVIEDRHERVETLKAAWSFARQALSIAVMPMGKVNLSGQRPYLDGYVTARGTFQKYFAQQELRDFIEEAIGEAPVALNSGIFAVFRDKDLEQEVLLRLRSRAVFRGPTIRPPVRERAVGTTTRPGLVERIGQELQALWDAMVDRGRVLDGDEFPKVLQERLQAARISGAKATRLCLSDIFDQGELASAAATRREDYLVHFALTLFPGAPRYAGLPKSIQRDVKVFFGSHSTALDEARSLLFSAGKTDVVQGGVDRAQASGLGAMRDPGTFRFQSAALTRLPAVLRVLVGSAAVLRGGIEGADFVDIKLQGPRVVFITCSDVTARLPIVFERTRVDLSRLRTAVERPDGMVLYLKGRYLPHDDPEREKQLAFDRKILTAGIVSPEGKGPSYPELQERLRRRRRDEPAGPPTGS